MGAGRGRREFRRESFAQSRDWVHFLVEFELMPCVSCRARARIRPGAPPDWRCAGCGEGERGAAAVPPALPLHPDLWLALLEGRETTTSCEICRERVPLSRTWISPDARRLYCRSHLRPIAAEDRLRSAERFLAREPAPVGAAAGGHRGAAGCSPLGAAADLRLLRLAAHLRGGRCARCPFNGSAIYDRGRCLEVEPDRRSCTSAPDALNCAGVDH